MLIAPQRLKENAKKLVLRPEAFEELLGTLGFGPALHLGIIGDGGQSIAYPQSCHSSLLSDF